MMYALHDHPSCKKNELDQLLPEKKEKNDKWHHVEYSSGKFLRRFRLSKNAKVDKVKAGIKNGVLTVIVPKVEIKKPEVKSIDISGLT
ncbi:hypothetical protein AgCh_028136 [Apium graveolens]